MERLKTLKQENVEQRPFAKFTEQHNAKVGQKIQDITYAKPESSLG